MRSRTSRHIWRPTLFALPACSPLTAAKIIGETAGIDRFKSRDGYSRYNGTAPSPGVAVEQG